MLGLSPSDYVLRALSNVNTNDLEQTLLVCEQRSLYCSSNLGTFISAVFKASSILYERDLSFLNLKEIALDEQ